MTTTTHATPEPDDSTTTALPVTRGLSTGTIVGIALGGVALAAVLFGGGVAVGTVLPDGTPGGSSQTGFPSEDRVPGERGPRPEAPRGDANPSNPSAPNSDQTETQDDADAGS